MADLKDVLVYLIGKYPYPSELSNARVTKLVYLADWRHAITHGRQLTDITWYFDNYGPFVWDVKNVVESAPDLFACDDTANMYGDRKRLFSLVNTSHAPHLSAEERNSLDHVIDATKALNWAQFIKLIYSTYPVMSSERYSNLDLARLAKDYKENFAPE
jgi:hypothetical protein